MKIRHTRSARRSIESEEGSGLTAEAKELIQLIDLEDPAWAKTVTVLSDMRAAGLDINEGTAAIALKLGRQRWAKDEQAIKRNKPKADQPNSASIVYYIRRGDLIKIGTTVNPHSRFRDLLPDEILAFEPGDRHQEMLRHHEFSHLRKGAKGEHFIQGPDLLFHIDRVRGVHGDPDPSWPSLATVGALTALAELPTPESLELVTAHDGAIRLGIKVGTVHQWVNRNRLVRAGVDARRRPLYFLDHIADLQARGGLRIDTPNGPDVSDQGLSTGKVLSADDPALSQAQRLRVSSCLEAAMRQDIEVPASGLVGVELAAKIAQVKPGTIYQWKRRGHLKPAVDIDGKPHVDNQGRQLYEVIDVIDAEFRTREHARRPAPSYA